MNAFIRHFIALLEVVIALLEVVIAYTALFGALLGVVSCCKLHITQT